MKMSAVRVVTASSLETKGLLLLSGEPLADPHHHLQEKHFTYSIDGNVVIHLVPDLKRSAWRYKLKRA